MMDAVIFERKEDALAHAEMVLRNQGVLPVCKPKLIVQAIEMNTIHNTFDGTVDWPRQWIVIPLSQASIDDLMPKVEEMIKKIKARLANAEDVAAEAEAILATLQANRGAAEVTVDSVWSGDEVID